jgi:probable rRNA maturation factor
MKIQIENRQTGIKIERRRIRVTVLKILKIMNCADKEISISFTDDENIKKLNEQYLGRNKPTNVLSFSLQEGEYGNINPQTLGDVVISVETAQQDAVQGKLTFEQEIDFLLIHGILHLLGYNHENTTAEETKKMKQKEKEIFNKISI